MKTPEFLAMIADFIEVAKLTGDAHFKLELDGNDIVVNVEGDEVCVYILDPGEYEAGLKKDGSES